MVHSMKKLTMMVMAFVLVVSASFVVFPPEKSEAVNCLKQGANGFQYYFYVPVSWPGGNARMQLTYRNTGNSQFRVSMNGTYVNLPYSSTTRSTTINLGYHSPGNKTVVIQNVTGQGYIYLSWYCLYRA